MHRLRLMLALTLVALVAACGGSTPSSGAVASEGTSSPAPLATDERVGSEEPQATDDPVPTDEPIPTQEPEPTDEPAVSDDPDATESPSDEAGSSAEACSGNASNRDFFEDIARAVEWPVLCGVLPRGWFVAQGSYRLANGGKLIVSYKGPAGASITLSEGAYCLADAAACRPSGADLGDAALGPLGGTLYETTDGYAIVVAAGENPGWSMVTRGLTQETTVSLGAALAQVGS